MAGGAAQQQARKKNFREHIQVGKCKGRKKRPQQKVRNKQVAVGISVYSYFLSSG